MAYRRTPAVQQRLDELRIRLIDAAIEQVAEHGYGGCSISAVASAADVGTGTVYRHFANTGELFTEVFRIVCGHEVEAMADAGVRAQADTGRFVDAITASVCTFAERALRAPTLAYALLVEPVDPQIDTERLRFREAFRNAVATSIDAAIEAGEIPAQDGAFTAACIVGAIGEALVAPLARDSADPSVIPSITTFTRRSIGVSDAHNSRGLQSGSAAGELRCG